LVVQGARRTHVRPPATLLRCCSGGHDVASAFAATHHKRTHLHRRRVRSCRHAGRGPAGPPPVGGEGTAGRQAGARQAGNSAAVNNLPLCPLNTLPTSRTCHHLHQCFQPSLHQCFQPTKPPPNPPTHLDACGQDLLVCALLRERGRLTVDGPPLGRVCGAM
jgi:hypothetical protein